MNSSMSSFKKLPHSLNLLKSKTFKKQNNSHLSRYISPFAKLSNIFSKNQVQFHKEKKQKKSLSNKKNMTCINLGIEDQHIFNYIHTPNPSIHTYQKSREIRTQRNTKKLLSTIKIDRSNGYKRISHQSLSNIAYKFNIFSGNGQKQILRKFQKKLLNTLHKKQQSQKTQRIYCNSRIKHLNDFSNSEHEETRIDMDQSKQNSFEKVMISTQISNKWKFLAQKIDNSRQRKFYQKYNFGIKNIHHSSFYPKKLLRRHIKHNTTSQLIVSSFISPTSSTNITNINAKQKNSQQKQRSLLSQNYKKTLLLEEKLKFKKIIISNANEKQNDSIKEIDLIRQNKSQNKLKKLLKCRNSCPNIFKQQFTPWDITPTQRQICTQN